jgi:uncharacterized protein (UPF0333 family)
MIAIAFAILLTLPLTLYLHNPIVSKMMRTSRSTLMRIAARTNSTSHQASRAMSANAKVWIDKDTRVICQGFTGKQVRYKRITKMTRRLSHRRREIHPCV